MKNGFRNWSHLRVFLAVVRAGSTLAASRRLGMAQPTVARQIAALEHECGLTLFQRDTRGFQPTEAARALLPEAEAVEAAAAGFAAAAAGLNRVRPIRITAFSANFSVRASRIFSDFSEAHPEVKFEFLPGVKVLDLMAGEADIALRLTRSDPDPDLICRRISTARFTLYGAKAYAEKCGLPASPGDLRGHRFVTFERTDVPNVLHEWLMDHAAPEDVILSTGEVDLMHAAILSGRALGLMNVRLAEAHPELVACFDPPGALSSEHLLLVSPEAWRRPEVKAFVAFFGPRYAAMYR